MPNPGVLDNEPYVANDIGLVGALRDLKETMADKQTYSVVGYQCITFENVVQGEALYCRASDGKVGKAIANDTLDKATCIGFARTTKTTDQDVDVVTHGQLSSSSLTTGSDYYLSAVTSGAITTTPPSGSGKYLVRVGRASGTAQLIVKIEAPMGRS